MKKRGIMSWVIEFAERRKNYYGGVDITILPLDRYMGQIAYVAQDNYLFDMSIKENIRPGYLKEV